MRAAEENGAQSVLICGGVASNAALTAELKKRAEAAGMVFSAPALQYNGDNAVMIAAASYLGTAHPADTALPNLHLL
jgi:N6-L-threonylcarbamoyladenine synthase